MKGIKRYKHYVMLSLFLSAFAFALNGQSIEQQADSIQLLIESAKEDTIRAKYSVAKGALYIYNEPSKAVQLLHKALAFSKKIEFEKTSALTYQYLFNAHDILGSHADSLMTYIQLLETSYQKTGKIEYKVKTHWHFAIYYLNFRQNDKVIEEYLKALKLVRQYHLKKSDEARLLGNLGTVFNTNGDYKNALKYYEQAAPLFGKDKMGTAITYYNMAIIYKNNLNEIDTAINLLNEAYLIAEEYEDYSLIADLLVSQGAVYEHQEQYDLANERYQKAFKIAQKHNLGENLLNIYKAYAEYYFNTKQYAQAIQYSNKAIKIGEEKEDARLLKELYELQDKCYRTMGNYKKAYELKEKLMTHLEILNDTELQGKFKELQTKYEVEQKELENKLLKSESEVTKRQIRNTTFTVIGLVIILILVIGWSFTVQTANHQRKVFNNELQTKNEALKTLDEAKTRFFSNVSHEFKTPLTLIINPISRLLKGGRLNDEDQFLAKSAEQNSFQLLELTNQVLELTKFEVNNVNINPIIFNLKQASNKLYGDFESLAHIQKIKFEIQTEINEALNIELDYTKFTTIIKNLLSNAVKFTPENGQVFFKIFEKEKTIQVQITDTGRGIHVSDLPHIFDRYYQAKVTNHLEEGGTGIGLAICAEYAKLLGGELQVQSEYGQGSTFILTLPKNAASVDALSNRLFQQKNELKIASNEAFQNSMIVDENLASILIVEDNKAMQSYLRLILKDFYQLEIAPHGKAALDILKEKHASIKLIISDVMMPEMNGYELLKHLKQDQQYAAIPTIMLTALSGTDEKLKALRIGIDDYLTKPFVDEELLARIDNLLQNRAERIAYIENNTKNDTFEVTLSLTEIHPKDLEWLENLEQYVLNNMAYTLVADEMAKHLEISRRTLYSKLKEVTGLTPSQYINEIRFRTARKLLEENENWTVKAIALKVGFKDEKNFSRNFKKRFGPYPSEYLT
jgi:signal transduction histidine kinase/DNA-binding response OmpR family regulator